MRHLILDHPACSVRLHNFLSRLYPFGVKTDRVREDVLTCRLHPTLNHGYGKRTHSNLCSILGIDELLTQRVKIKPYWNYHPITGKKLKP